MGPAGGIGQIHVHLPGVSYRLLEGMFGDLMGRHPLGGNVFKPFFLPQNLQNMRRGRNSALPHVILIGTIPSRRSLEQGADALVGENFQ